MDTDLIARLRDGCGEVRAQALLGLAAQGHPGPEVALFLRDADAHVARTAAEALVRLGPVQRAHLPAIAATLDEARPEVVDIVARMFAELVGQADRELTTVLDTASAAAARAIVEACERTEARGLELLHRAARDPRPRVRINAVHGIALLGVRDPEGSFEVLRAVERADDIADVRAATRTALGALKARCMRAAAARHRTSDPPPSTLEQRALTAAELAAASATESLGELLRLLDAPAVHARLNAVRALALQKPTSAETVNMLATRLRDPDPTVRREAAQTLGTTAAVPALVAALDDRDPAVGAAAEASLAAMGVGAAPGLLDGLDTPSAVVGGRVAALIGRLPHGAQLLANALSFSSVDARIHAAAGLGAMRATGALPALLACASARNARLRDAVAKAIAAIEPSPERAPPPVAGFETALLERVDGATAGQVLPFLQDARAVVRANVATALGGLGDAARALELRTLLRDDEPSVRIAAARALDKLGDDAVLAAAPALVEAMRGDTAVHAACRAVLASRGGKVEAALVAGLETDDEVHALRVAELICALPNAPHLLFAAYDGPAQNVQVSAALGIGLLGASRAGDAGRIRLRNGLAGPITRRHHAVVKALALFER